MKNIPIKTLTTAASAFLVAMLILWFWFDYKDKHDAPPDMQSSAQSAITMSFARPIRLFDSKTESDYEREHPGGTAKTYSSESSSLPEDLEKQGNVSAAEVELKQRLMAAERELDNASFTTLRSQNASTYSRQQTVANTQLDIQLNKLAEFYERTGNLAEQERLLKFKTEFAMATMPPTCAFRDAGMYELRRAYIKQKRFTEAADLAAREADILEQDPLYPNRWYIKKLRRHRDSLLEKARLLKDGSVKESNSADSNLR